MRIAIVLLSWAACVSFARANDLNAAVLEQARKEGLVRLIIDICHADELGRRVELKNLSDAYLHALSSNSNVPLSDLQHAAQEASESAQEERSAILNQCNEHIAALETSLYERRKTVERLLTGESSDVAPDDG